MSELALSIVVCTRNGEATLRGCLEALLGQSLDAAAYEVVVVNNASTDRTAQVVDEIAARDERVRRVDEREPGKSRAANAGLRSSRASVVAFADDDVVAPANWARRIVAAFREAEPPQVLLGHVDSRFETEPPAWLSAWLRADAERRTAGGARELRAGREVYIAYGANFAFDRATLVASGGFDERWGPVGSDRRYGGEDIEVVARLAARGCRVRYDPELCVEHREPAGAMQLRYRMQRTFLQGVMVSRLEGTRLLSARTARGVAALLQRTFAGSAGRAGAAMAPGGEGAGVRGADLLLRAAAVAGRVWGATLIGRRTGDSPSVDSPRVGSPPVSPRR